MKPELILNIDNYDEAVVHMEHYGEKLIKGLIRKSFDAGFKGINWRVSVCGKLDYQTEGPDLLNEVWHPESRHLVDLLKTGFDPLAVAVEECKKYSMKIFPWLTIFDEGPVSLFDKKPYGEATAELLRRNPHFQMVSRDGKEYFKGVPCYAYPEVEEYKLEQIKELVRYEVDGIFVCFRSHSPMPAGENLYGYNEPVVREYKQRYGRDILKEEFDVHLWKKIQGEYVTGFLRRLNKELNGRDLTVNVDRGCLGGLIHTDWQTWAKEEIVSGLCYSEDLWGITIEWVKDFFRTFDPTNPEVFVKKEEYLPRKLNKTALYFWHNLWNWRYPEGMKKQINKPDEVVRDTLERLLSLPLSGVVLHECQNIEESDAWSLIRKICSGR
jgi:hypothetical protein